MRSRVLRWSLVGLAFVAFFIWGFFAHRNRIFPYSLVRTPSPRRVPLDESVNVQHGSTASDALQGLPYLGGAEDFDEEALGVVHFDRERAHPGLNFYYTEDAHTSWLMDMEGRVLHEWVSPEGRLDHAELLPNGDVLAIVRDSKLVRLDRESRVLWSYRSRVHHDLCFGPDGDIHVLSRHGASVPEVHPETKVLADTIHVVTHDGERKRVLSILDLLRASDYAFLVPDLTGREFVAREAGKKVELDILHTNRVEVFDGSLERLSPLFRRGNILISMRNISTIAIIDPQRMEVVWAWGPSNLVFQHYPTLLETGRILVFSNGVERSEIVEMDPLTGRILWRYAPESGFFSKLRGCNQRLPNGNTLITESDKGQAREITPEGEVVWRFANPHADEEGKRVVITKMIRLRAEDLTFLSN